MTGRLETRARLRAACHGDRIVWRTECCGVLMRGQCIDCPVTVPMRPHSQHPFADPQGTVFKNCTADNSFLDSDDKSGETGTLHQRAHYPEDWHPHGYFMKRVRLFAWLAAIGLVGAVAWRFF